MAFLDALDTLPPADPARPFGAAVFAQRGSYTEYHPPIVINHNVQLQTTARIGAGAGVGAGAKVSCAAKVGAAAKVGLLHQQRFEAAACRFKQDAGARDAAADYEHIPVARWRERRHGRTIPVARTHLDFFAFTGHSSWQDMERMQGGRELH